MAEDNNLKIEYKRQHNDSIMVVEARDVISSYEEKMIEENKIDALLPMSTINVNGVQQYNYNISRKENLEDFLEGHDLNLELFRRIVLNIHLAYEEIGKYLINERHIWLSPETVFLEKSMDSFRISLCYYPKDMGSVQEHFRVLMELFLKWTPASDRKFTKLIYSAFDLCLKEDYTLGEILECLQDEVDEEIHVERINLREDDTPQRDYSEPRVVEDYRNYELMDYEEDFTRQPERIMDFYEEEPEEKAGIFSRMGQSIKGILCKKIEFKDVFERSSNEFDDRQTEDFIIDPDYEIDQRTQLLTEVRPSGKLVYDGENREDDFLVNKDVFRIGSARTNDAVLKERTVSANHAKITREGDDYYISDLNSTNSTFVNNKQLVYKCPVKLKIMDKISFANVSYVFM